MTKRLPTSVVLLAALLAGCGQGPVAGARLDAVAVKPASPVQPQTLAPVPTLVTRQTADEAIAAEAGAAKVAPVQETHLFDHNFDASELKRANYTGDDDAVKKELEAQNIGLAPGASWGLIGAGAVAALLGIPAVGYAVYTGMIGSRDLMYPKDKETLAKTPQQYGITYQRDTFKSHDGLWLVGWYVPAEVPTTKGIMIFHGHTSNKDKAFLKYGEMLHHDYNIYMYDSRFHGESEGKLTTLGYFERQDAPIAIQRLRDRGNTSIGVMGESMGGAVAILAAADDENIKACWADCAFDSLHDAIAPRAKNRNYPFPDYVATSVVATASIRARAPIAKADPIKWVDKISPRPLYLIHGQADGDTTPENSEKLFEKAKEPKTIWRTEGAKHAQSWELYPAEYKSRMNAFFNAAL